MIEAGPEVKMGGGDLSLTKTGCSTATAITKLDDTLEKERYHPAARREACSC